MCANWQAGTCLAQVCARDADYSEQPGAVADRFAGEPMTCIHSQESAVVSDCPDYGNACGSYRYWLIAPPNAWNGGAQQDEAREADRAAASGSNDANGGKARQ